MGYLPDERFRHFSEDLAECLDAIENREVEKKSEKKKAVNCFILILDFCKQRNIIASYDSAKIHSMLGLASGKG